MADTSYPLGRCYARQDGVRVVPDGAKILVEAGGHFDEESQARQTKSADFTAAEADVGKCTDIDTDGVVVTLPATVAGMTFRFRNVGAAGAVGFSLSPNASDKIMGVGLTAADDKDLTNTKATAKTGDEVQLVGDGVNGWYVQRLVGTWAREA